MNKTNFMFLGAVFLMAVSCDSTAQPGNTSVETQNANTNYKPAFMGQTRIGAVTTKTPYELKLLTSSLRSPWGIVSLPDGRFIITEKSGTMRIVSASGAVGDPLDGSPAVNSRGQGGLLGLCIDPSFANNRMVYWAFSEPLPEGNVTSVARGILSSDEKGLEQVAVIYRATPAYDGALHYGGRVLFSKDGHLFLTTGERSDRATRPQAQDINSGLGKIIRLTRDGKPAPGNPFAGRSRARPELYSYGHRNVQGIAFHPVTGDLWETEFGPRGGDELNRIVAGKNYGWPIITYGIEYGGSRIGDAIQQKEGLEQPVYYWDPVISPSGITFYDARMAEVQGTEINEWKNNLFIATLSGGHICRLVIENNRVTGEERLFSGERQRFRDITQGRDGAMYTITDQGRLYRIGKK